MFFLFIGASDVCKIPGISAAGANPAVIPFTAAADADVLYYGRPRVVDAVPVDPEGHPTPALITRAAWEMARFPFIVVRCGSYLPPACPHVDLKCDPGGDPSLVSAVPNAREVFDAACELGRSMGGMKEPYVIGESVPGGTTTALMVLRSLGVEGMVSSAGPLNPINLKETIWQKGCSRCGGGFGAFRDDPLKAVREMGDPMQAAVAGFVFGLPRDARVVLAGGTQMLAVLAVLRAMGWDGKVVVATTKYVAQDRSCAFLEMASSLGAEPYAAPLDFSRSPHKGLADYEKGYVKEGVGAGGAFWYARELGVSVEKLCGKVEEIYSLMMGFSG
ncbi:TIGR00303 family protein [Thermanaerovibrio velox DSM 12556]|uniref:TIGR00303 family protein n=1 Tax=Thermanaerovibrio velox DSM 12556 TaxID=926567 RepID=H0UNC0_9BACT|nr:TIGR00303 family protein [Thermanaerovibrio velox]EHM10405.1 TIGR00303 family protein [Thermanaerovibrio velox DSM 12556]